MIAVGAREARLLLGNTLLLRARIAADMRPPVLRDGAVEKGVMDGRGGALVLALRDGRTSAIFVDAIGGAGSGSACMSSSRRGEMIGLGGGDGEGEGASSITANDFELRFTGGAMRTQA